MQNFATWSRPTSRHSGRRVIGLTGSIGMGKSATAAMFSRRGVPVHDSDAVVHRLYVGEAAPLIEAAFPGVTTDGKVDRARLAERIVGDPAALAELEAIVHPLVRQSEERFRSKAKAQGHRLALVDVPLLFETGAAGRFDILVVVTADPKIQRERVLTRPGMTEEKFVALLARQMPDGEKRRRAHFLVDTGRGLAAAEREVDAMLRALASVA
jgi:dephospho-CoA kinase